MTNGLIGEGLALGALVDTRIAVAQTGRSLIRRTGAAVGAATLGVLATPLLMIDTTPAEAASPLNTAKSAACSADFKEADTTKAVDAKPITITTPEQRGPVSEYCYASIAKAFYPATATLSLDAKSFDGQEVAISGASQQFVSKTYIDTAKSYSLPYKATTKDANGNLVESKSTITVNVTDVPAESANDYATLQNLSALNGGVEVGAQYGSEQFVMLSVFSANDGTNKASTISNGKVSGCGITVSIPEFTIPDSPDVNVYRRHDDERVTFSDENSNYLPLRTFPRGRYTFTGTSNHGGTITASTEVVDGEGSSDCVPEVNSSSNPATAAPEVTSDTNNNGGSSAGNTNENGGAVPQGQATPKVSKTPTPSGTVNPTASAEAALGGDGSIESSSGANAAYIPNEKNNGSGNYNWFNWQSIVVGVAVAVGAVVVIANHSRSKQNEADARKGSLERAQKRYMRKGISAQAASDLRKIIAEKSLA